MMMLVLILILVVIILYKFDVALSNCLLTSIVSYDKVKMILT